MMNESISSIMSNGSSSSSSSSTIESSQSCWDPIFERYIEHHFGRPVNAIDDCCGQTPLFEAIHNGDETSVMMILLHYQNFAFASTTSKSSPSNSKSSCHQNHICQSHYHDYIGATALHLAVQRNRSNIVKLLLEHSTPATMAPTINQQLLYQTTRNGETALHYAVIFQRHDLVKLLLSFDEELCHGVDSFAAIMDDDDDHHHNGTTDQERRPKHQRQRLVNIQTPRGETALSYAMKLEDTNMIRLLLQAQNQITYQTSNVQQQHQQLEEATATPLE